MKTFLDTGVLIAAFRGDNEAAEQALSILSDANREFISSDFVRLELLPKAKYYKNSDEVEFYEQYFTNASLISSTTPEHIHDSFTLACDYGIDGADATIICAACGAGADVFITSEKPSKPMFRIPKSVLNIETVYKKLEDETKRGLIYWIQGFFRRCFKKP